MSHSTQQPPAQTHHQLLGWLYAFSAAVMVVVCSLPLAWIMSDSGGHDWVVSDGDQESGLERVGGFLLYIPLVALGMGVVSAVLYFKLWRTAQARKRAIWGMWLLAVGVGFGIYRVTVPNF